MLSDLRLYQLISPTLPVGSFAYSQGLEWAVEAGWVHNAHTFEQWLDGLRTHSIATLELPILLRLQQAFKDNNDLAISRWSNYLVASRETMELRTEERQRGTALAKLLPNLDISIPVGLEKSIASTQLAGLALAANHWSIAPLKIAAGYTWSWLENSVMAGVKLIPLGQTQGQKILLCMAEKIPDTIALAAELPDSEIGSSTPAQAIASSKHETQYTRLFRS